MERPGEPLGTTGNLMIVSGWLVSRFPKIKAGTAAGSTSEFAEDELWALFLTVVPASMGMTVLFWALGSETVARAGLDVLMFGLGWMTGETIPLQLLSWRRLGLDNISRPFWRILVPATFAVAVGALSIWL